MIFKELKPNYMLFVLDKQSMTCDECKVVSVSAPRFENKVGTMPQSVVDVTIEQGGKNMTYVFPDGLTKAYSGNLVFCINKEDVIADIKAMKRASEQILADVARHEETVTKCNQLLADLDTEEKERQKTEERFGKIESSIGQLTNMFSSFMKEWSSPKQNQ